MKRWVVSRDLSYVKEGSPDCRDDPPWASRTYIYITARDELDAWLKAKKWKEQNDAPLD